MAMVKTGDYAQWQDRAVGAASNHASGRSQPLWGAALVGAVHQIRSRVLPCMVGGALLTVSAGAAQQAPSPKASAAPVNAFQEQAARLGVRQCANLFATLGQGATNGAAYAVQVQANRAAPDAHAAIGVAGITYDQPNYKGSAAGVVLVTPVGKGCEGTMVRVAPFQASCQEVVRQFPAGSSVATTLSGTPLYNLGGNQGQALLVANGAGCVVVTVVPAAAPG